jgi:sporulation protein YqfC
MFKAAKYILERTKQIQSQLAETFEIPQDALLNLPRITMIGDAQFYLENHRGIIEYTSEKIRVSILGGRHLQESDRVGHQLS